MRVLSLFLVLILCSCSQPSTNELPANEAQHSSNINWRHEWNDQIFEDASRDHKLVILSLEAIWCHWCHVMQAETYPNPQVEKLLNEHFISVSIDQDSNAYLSNRYKKYGWPATIIFNSKGEEIVKRAGYIQAEIMTELLEDVIKDPSPRKDYDRKIKYSKTSYLSKASKATLEAKYKRSLDLKKGGLKIAQKYVDRDTVEYGLNLAPETDGYKHAIKTLKAALGIMDKAWGGFYQYSTHYNWNNPHYEKLAKTQAEYLRIYSLAQLRNPGKDFTTAIDSIVQYLDDFMTDSSGGFYTSQDADLVQGEKATEFFKLNDRERRARGIPRVDKNIYPDKNGRMIEALAIAYRATQDSKLLNRALKATKYINANFRSEAGAYSHGKQQNSYLSDNLFMARALLALYEVTTKPEYLEQAISTTKYIVKHYRSDQPGYLSNDKAERLANAKINRLLKPVPLADENIKLARFLNRISHYSGIESFKAEAKYIMQYLGSETLIKEGPTEPGVLLLDNELAEDPTHFTIVGSKQDSKAKALYKVALSYPTAYIRVEHYDPKQGKLFNHDVEYPELPRAAAFTCVNHACSLPVYEAAELKENLAEL